MHQRVVVLILFFCAFTMGATPVRLEVMGNELSKIEILSLTEAAIQQELDWRFSFDSTAKDIFHVVVVGVAVDEDTFGPKELYQVTLEFAWHEVQVTRTLAFLVGPNERWQSLYTASLKRLIRLNLGNLWIKEGASHITHALDSGYWTTSSLQLKRGRRVLIRDARNKPIAIMEVADVFDYPEIGVVTELRPVWAKRPLAHGMPLEKLTFDFPMELSGNFSLSQYGFSLGVGFPLWVGPFRISSRLSVDTIWGEPTYEVLFHLGLKTQMALGSFSTSMTSLGKWWSNIQVLAGVHLGVGGTWTGSGTLDFLYGAGVDLQLLYQSSSHLYWGVAVGYHQRVSRETNEGRITLSPTLGWLW